MGLLRAATPVSIMSVLSTATANGNDDKMMHSLWKDRKRAAQIGLTLTHWVNKVAPLAEERPDHVTKERLCVDFIKYRQQQQQLQRKHKKTMTANVKKKIVTDNFNSLNIFRPKVLMEWEAFSIEQKRLVVGQDVGLLNDRFLDWFVGLTLHYALPWWCGRYTQLTK
jgi:hypothetical protein